MFVLTKLDVDTRDLLSVPFDQVFEKDPEQFMRSVSTACDDSRQEHMGARVPFDVQRSRHSIATDFGPAWIAIRVSHFLDLENFMFVPVQIVGDCFSE